MENQPPTAIERSERSESIKFLSCCKTHNSGTMSKQLVLKNLFYEEPCNQTQWK